MNDTGSESTRVVDKTGAEWCLTLRHYNHAGFGEHERKKANAPEWMPYNNTAGLVWMPDLRGALPAPRCGLSATTTSVASCAMRLTAGGLRLFRRSLRSSAMLSGMAP